MSMNRSLFKFIIVLCIQSIGLTCISAQNLEDPFNEAMKLFNDYDMMEYAPNHFFYVAFQIIGKYLLFINCLLSIT